MGRFKKGLVLGGLLGAALAWLNTSPQGKQTRQKLIKASGDVLDQIKKEIEDRGLSDKLTKNKYVKIANKKVDEYIKKNPWAKDMATSLMKKANSKWSTFKKKL